MFFFGIVVALSDVLQAQDERSSGVASTQSTDSSGVRDPWLWGPRIGSGIPSRMSIRDVGGYVYISTPKFRCNGALIDPEWVLTSAGCVVEESGARPQISASSIKVVPGCYDGVNCVINSNPLWYGTRTTTIGVQRVIISPYTVADLDLKVALLKLSSPVTTGNGVSVFPIGVSSESVVGMSGLMVMSYGDTEPNKGPSFLQRAQYRVVSDSACSVLNAKGFQPAIHHCGEVTPRVCKSDIGAPIVRLVNGQPVLYGMLSSQYAMYGNSCPTNSRSVAIDVTSDTFRDWVTSQISSGRSGLVKNVDGTGGLGTAYPRGNDLLHTVDVSSIFPQGIRIGNRTSTIIRVNENGVIALGDSLLPIPAYMDISKWTSGGPPVIVAFGADGSTVGNAQRAPIGSASTGSNQVWVAMDVAQKTVTVTWDDIRPLSSRTVTGDRFIGNSYQTELRALPGGDVRVTMRYGVIGWTAGANQCNARGCSVAQIGIADGRGRIERGLPTTGNLDTHLRQLSGKQLAFHLRNGTIYAVNRPLPARRTHNPIFMWTGSASTIPTGWRRVTELDGKFPRVLASGETVLSTGGSATHTHSSPGHTHNMTSHTHSFSVSGRAGSTETGGNGSQSGISADHSHGTATSGSVANLSVSADSVTYSEASHTPPYYDVIFITKDDATVIGVPPSAVAFTSYLDKLTLANGNNGTPSLRNMFIRGAASGADGGITGGVTSHTHTADHSHSTSHQHNPVTSRTASGHVGINSNEDDARNNHSHTITLNPATLQSENASITVQSGTVLPPYLDVIIGQNRTTAEVVQFGLLAYYIGNENDLPTGWRLYSRVGRFLRGASSTGATGGSETHSHGTQSHSHQLQEHSHTTPDLGHSTSGGLRDSTGSTTYTRAETYHPSTTTSGFTSSLLTGSVSANPASNMPEYVNVYLIEYVGN